MTKECVVLKAVVKIDLKSMELRQRKQKSDPGRVDIEE